MTQLLAYLFADHHSGGGHYAKGIDDSEFSMEQIVEKALKEKPSWVISLGDAVNKAHTYAESVVPLKNQLRRLTRAGISVGFIDGNHDKRHMSWLADDEFVHLDLNPVSIGPYVTMGLDFRPRGLIQAALEEVPKSVNLLLMHQGWGDFMRFEDSYQADFSDIPSHVKFLATGDFHGDLVIDTYKNKGNQKLLVCNPGSTSIQDIVEPDRKFFVALMDDEKKPFVPVELNTRILLRESAHNQRDLERLLKEIRPAIDAAYTQAGINNLPEHLHKPYLHITYSSSLEDLPRRLDKLVGTTAHLFYKELRPESVNKPVGVKLESSNGEAFNPLSLLSLEINPEDPEDPLAKDAYHLAEQLYHGKDKQSIIKMVHEWVADQTKGD